MIKIKKTVLFIFLIEFLNLECWKKVTNMQKILINYQYRTKLTKSEQNITRLTA